MDYVYEGWVYPKLKENPKGVILTILNQEEIKTEYK